MYENKEILILRVTPPIQFDMERPTQHFATVRVHQR